MPLIYSDLKVSLMETRSLVAQARSLIVQASHLPLNSQHEPFLWQADISSPANLQLQLSGSP